MDSGLISGERRLGHDDLMARVARAAAMLSRLGVGEGDAVAVVLRNDFAFFEAAMAAQHLGAYAVPVNWHFRADEAGYILADCAAKAVVAHADLLPGIAGNIPAGVPVLVVATPPEIVAAYGIDPALAPVPPGRDDWDALRDAHPPHAGQPKPRRANMIYTSGTTGRPKGVRREAPTPPMLEVMAEMVGLVFGLKPGARVRTAMVGPMYHAAPNTYGLTAARNGGLVVLQPRFDAEDLLRLIERHRLTHLHMVPTMFVRLLKLPEEVRRRHDLSSLEWVVHAAAPCPPEVKRRMIEWWGPVIYEYYGSTETGANTFHGSAEALAKPGTVGKPTPFSSVKVLDEAGRELPPGEIGELYMRIRGYPDFTYHGRDEERRAIERDGLITTGDLAYRDADGYVFVCDRRKDMVISGGVNIYPAEIEAELHTMPGVRDCAVFGVPDEEFGEALCAWIEPDPGAEVSREDVRAFLATRLARYKVPKTIEIAAALPREDSGKIFKRRLREPYWAAAGRRI